MKRFALAGFVLSLVAGTAAAQSGPDDEHVLTAKADGIVLKGVDPMTNDTRQEAANGAAPHVATCDKCHHEWTDCCCEQRGWTMWAEWMLLEPKGADPVFAVESNNCTSPPLGPAQQIDFGAFSGFKIGIFKTLCDGCSDIGGTFMHYEANEEFGRNSTPPNVIRPLVAVLPTCDNVTSTVADASASINFDRLSIDYRRWMDGNCFRLDWMVGFAYGQLTQDLRVAYDTSKVRVDTGSWGYGVHVGGGGEFGKGCIRGFAHGDFTLLNANSNAKYVQIDNFIGKVAEYSQHLDRITPILDLELGVSMDLTRCSVLKVGYQYSFWFNTVTTPDFVQAVQKGNITGDLGQTLTFDGLFARLEVSW